MRRLVRGSDLDGFSMDNTIRRSDGTMSAEITSTPGLLDLNERRVVPDVRARDWPVSLALCDGRTS